MFWCACNAVNLEVMLMMRCVLHAMYSTQELVRRVWCSRKAVHYAMQRCAAILKLKGMECSSQR